MMLYKILVTIVSNSIKQIAKKDHNISSKLTKPQRTFKDLIFAKNVDMWPVIWENIAKIEEKKKDIKQ